MLIYFEFVQKRRKADLQWLTDKDKLIVHLSDQQLTTIFPEDLFFSIEEGNKVVFEAEDILNVRLLDLQKVLRRRLQEIVHSN